MTWIHPASFSKVSSILIALGGLTLIMILLILSFYDARDYQGHLSRIRELEGETKYKYKEPSKSFPYPLEKIMSCIYKDHEELRGNSLMLVAWLILVLFNLYILIVSIFRCSS
jgi:hypothetical protein